MGSNGRSRNAALNALEGFATKHVYQHRNDERHTGHGKSPVVSAGKLIEIVLGKISERLQHGGHIHIADIFAQFRNRGVSQFGHRTVLAAEFVDGSQLGRINALLFGKVCKAGYLLHRHVVIIAHKGIGQARYVGIVAQARLAEEIAGHLIGGSRCEKGTDVDGHIKNTECRVALAGIAGIVIKVAHHHLQVSLEQTCTQRYGKQSREHGSRTIHRDG